MIGTDAAVILDDGKVPHTSVSPGTSADSALFNDAELVRTRRPNGLERGDGAGDEGRLHLADRVVDTHAVALVQDLDPEQLRRGGGAVLVGRGQGDVKGQDLVGVPGNGRFLEALDFADRNRVQLVDGGVDGEGDGALELGVEDAGLVGGEGEVRLELGTDIVLVGQELTGAGGG